MSANFLLTIRKQETIIKSVVNLILNNKEM